MIMTFYLSNEVNIFNISTKLASIFHESGFFVKVFLLISDGKTGDNHSTSL